MQTEKSKKYCSVHPPFPKEGFLCSLTYRDALGSLTGVGSLYPLFFNTTHIKMWMKQTTGQLSEAERESIDPEITLMNLQFQSIFTIDESFWKNAGRNLSLGEREKAMKQLWELSDFYKVLVLPVINPETKEWEFRITAPFLQNTPDSTIASFMKNTTEPVDITATCVAFYTPGSRRSMNYVTGETVEDEEVKKSAKKPVN